MENHKIEFKRVLFTSLGGWLSFTRKATMGLLNGLLGVVFAIVAAIVSIAYKLWTLFVSLVHARPLLSVAMVSIVIMTAWLMAYVGKCAEAKTYEHQRDSLSYELSKMMQAYTPKDSTIVIADSTYIYCY